MQVVLIGSGGVASAIASELANCSGQVLCGIYSRQIEHATALRDRYAISCPVITDNLKSLPHADLYLVAVSDQAIPEVATALPRLDGLVLHTSAVTPMACFNKQRAYGVWYPFNSFSKEAITFDAFDGVSCSSSASSPELMFSCSATIHSSMASFIFKCSCL